jgi:subtilisin family serine protease
MRRRGLVIGLATAVVVAFSVASVAGAANKPTPVANPDDSFKPVVTPLGVGNALTTVVVQVAGDPVTVVDSDAAAPLSDSQKASLEQQLETKQKPVEQQIQSLGGKVLADYQNAYNGIKVQIPAKKADALGSINNVVAVHPLPVVKPSNIHGIPMIGAPAAWDGAAGVHGEGMKIAILDTGIDYTHADFGGPGTTAAFNTAKASSTLPADASLFGPAAPKVKGGTDLVGDDYNADPNDSNYQPVPHPDPNPLDCEGHGSHVAGTAAGFGVLSDGSTYAGPYTATTVSGHSWSVGPGVAPKADLYAVRVFGCAGSTNVVIDAIEWAVDHDMDVINMSLGAPYGTEDSPDAVAASNAAKDGVIVVVASGNNGHAPYITSSPASGTRTLSVAANDPTQTFPAANIAGGGSSPAIVANGATFPDGLSLQVKVLKNPNGTISLGCDPNEYTAAGVTGKLVVTARGTCARVARAVFGQKAGAAAVLMVNNADSFPPFEGKITGNPDTGEQFDVTIPFLGTPSSTANAWLAADGATVTLTNTTLNNPTFTALADFSSFGGRSGDSWLKPDVTAPGVSISSVAIGTGTGATIMSGTSMATPHTAGMAALVKQAHLSWNRVDYWKAAIANTANPGGIAGYGTRGGGTGLIQAPGAVSTQVIALGDKGTASLNYGFAELENDFSKTDTITLRNFSKSSFVFNVSDTLDQGASHSVDLGTSQVVVPARGTVNVDVTLHVPAGSAPTASDGFNDVAGEILFTPVDSTQNGGVALRVPYYFVPQAISRINVGIIDSQPSGNTTAANLSNTGEVTGNADWYSWGLNDKKDKASGPADVRAIGVQSFPGLIAFGISTFNRWSNPAANEFDVYVDVNNDGADDYVVVAADLGALQTGTANGQDATAVFNLKTGAGSIQFLTDAPMDSSTMVLPVLISQLCASGSPCLSSSNPRFTYHAVSFGPENAVDVVDGTARYNAFHPALQDGMFDTLNVGQSQTDDMAIDRTEFALTPALGWMVISHDDPSGADEADLLKVKIK